MTAPDDLIPLRQPYHSELRPLRSGATRFINWGRDQTCRAQRLARPRSEAELCSLLHETRDRGSTLKVVGAGHSWSDVACTRGTLVSLDAFGRLLSVDRERGQVRVQAGMRLHALNVALRERGLGLPILGSIAEQSVAGAISTGTHGSGARFGNLASGVLALRLVTADGTVRELSPTSEPELFAAARVSFGLLGVITEVTLRVEPAFDLEETQYPLPFDEAVQRLDEIVGGHEHVKLWWVPYTDEVQVFTANRSTAPRTVLTRADRFGQSAVMRRVYEALLGLGTLVPKLVPLLDRRIAGTVYQRARRVDRSEVVFSVPQVPRHRETEYAVARADAGRALRSLRDLIEARHLPANFIQELRFVAADDAWMSPAYGRDSAQLGAYMVPIARIDELFGEFERRMLALGGRPHWGKAHSLSAADARRVYPKYDGFVALRDQLDPGGLFDNAFSERVFPRVTGR